MKKKKETLIIVLTIILIILAGLIIEKRNILGSFLGIGNKQVVEDNAPEVNINYENLAPILSSSSLIQDLPEDGIVLLKFYNFNSGSREWEKSYILKKGKVTEGNIDNADLLVTLHSQYLNSLTNKNFCGMVHAANQKGDLGLEYSISKVKLLWKFKSMMKYRDCFGF